MLREVSGHGCEIYTHLRCSRRYWPDHHVDYRPLVPSLPHGHHSSLAHGAAGTVTGSKHLLGSSSTATVPSTVFCWIAACSKAKPCVMWITTPTAVSASNRACDRCFGAEPCAHRPQWPDPRLVAEGFDGPIYSTPATHDLCTIMLADSAHIQEYDHAYDVKRARKKGRNPKRTARSTPWPMCNRPWTSSWIGLCRPPRRSCRASPSPIPMPATFSEVQPYTSTSMMVNGPCDSRFTGDVGRYVDRLLPEPVAFSTGRCDHLRKHLRRPGSSRRSKRPRTNCCSYVTEYLREEQGQADHSGLQHREDAGDPLHIEFT